MLLPRNVHFALKILPAGFLKMGVAMEKISACQIAELSALAIKSDLQKYIDLLNQNIKPPVAVTVNDVHIRAMYIISDKVNSYGGRFDRSELPAIARLFIDSPVLIGHDKSGLPVARNFWAETVEKGDQLWVKCYFYWLKDTEGSAKLLKNIDSGIYKECSVSFTYAYPECSVCGEDIRNCGHRISDEVFFYYRGVDKILETSLVYRGSIPDTRITDQLSAADKDSSRSGGSAIGKSERFFTLVPALELFNQPAPAADMEWLKARINRRNFVMVRKQR
jgi:hypothetical protein